MATMQWPGGLPPPGEVGGSYRAYPRMQPGASPLGSVFSSVGNALFDWHEQSSRQAAAEQAAIDQEAAAAAVAEAYGQCAGDLECLQRTAAALGDKDTAGMVNNLRLRQAADVRLAKEERDREYELMQAESAPPPGMNDPVAVAEYERCSEPAPAGVVGWRPVTKQECVERATSYAKKYHADADRALAGAFDPKDDLDTNLRRRCFDDARAAGGGEMTAEQLSECYEVEQGERDAAQAFVRALYGRDATDVDIGAYYAIESGDPRELTGRPQKEHDAISRMQDAMGITDSKLPPRAVDARLHNLLRQYEGETIPGGFMPDVEAFEKRRGEVRADYEREIRDTLAPYWRNHWDGRFDLAGGAPRNRRRRGAPPGYQRQFGSVLEQTAGAAPAAPAAPAVNRTPTAEDLLAARARLAGAQQAINAGPPAPLSVPPVPGLPNLPSGFAPAFVVRGSPLEQLAYGVGKH